MGNLNFEKNFQLPWWVRIVTTNPSFIYYFGPFDSLPEAQNHCPGYIEDLVGEKAQVVIVDIDQYQPQDLTIDILSSALTTEVTPSSKIAL